MSIAMILVVLTGCTSPPGRSYEDYADVGGYEELGDFGVAAQSIDTEFGLSPNFADWALVRDLNCDGAAAGRDTLDGGWGPDSAVELPNDVQALVNDAAWAAALTAACPETLNIWVWDAPAEAALTAADPAWRRHVEPDPEPVQELQDDPAPVPPSSPPETSWESEQSYDDYGDWDWEMGVDGDGYSVQCSDGEWSNSGGKQGACSGHGGVG